MNSTTHPTSEYSQQQHMAEYEQAPAMPPRPQANNDAYEQPPAMPPRPQAGSSNYEGQSYLPPRSQGQDATMSGANMNFSPPPQHPSSQMYMQKSSESTTYLRDPHKLVGYLIPFPMPQFKKGIFHQASGKDVPQRFLIYTPPPPPLSAPSEGEKEGKAHKLQRKWQAEVREAKTNPQKVTSWKGLKGRATKGISAAMNWTTSSNLDFLNRIPGTSHDSHSDDGHDEGDETHRTVGLEEMVLLYPASLPGSPEQIRQEFLENMLRSKSKAERDAIMATGLLPVAAAIDILATLVWPFGGLLEIDGVWAYSSIRGAKTARSVTKRLNSTGIETSGDAKLQLTFTPTPRMEILYRYLAAECHKRNPKYFEGVGATGQPTESEVLEAIGWAPTQTGGETRNWEDEQWETQEVKDDFSSTMKKGAKEWDKWVKDFEKDPEKAMKK